MTMKPVTLTPAEQAAVVTLLVRKIGLVTEQSLKEGEEEILEIDITIKEPSDEVGR